MAQQKPSSKKKRSSMFDNIVQTTKSPAVVKSTKKKPPVIEPKKKLTTPLSADLTAEEKIVVPVGGDNEETLTLNRPIKEFKAQAEVVRKRLRRGRPSSFAEKTVRITADLPKSTVKELKKFLPGTQYRSQSEFVDLAIRLLLAKEKKNHA